MRYRQWKKNYKKQHGYNPSIIFDKRKQIKITKKLDRGLKNVIDDQMIATIYRLASGINSMSNAMRNLITVFKSL